MDDRVEFTLNGTRYTLSRGDVIQAMKGQDPGRIFTYAVDIDGLTYPVKQVLSQAIRVPVTSFVSTRAQDLLEKLGFEVANVEERRQVTRRGEIRALALGLAVELHARKVSPVDEVLDAAAQFEAWMHG